jgi:mRNA interferase MazF
MQNFSRNKIILVKYPFTDLADSKIRPAVIINESKYNDIFIVPLTSKTVYLTKDEFILQDWKNEGLNIQTAVKRGIYTINSNLILKEIGYLTQRDFEKMKLSILRWLNLL